MICCENWFSVLFCVSTYVPFRWGRRFLFTNRANKAVEKSKCSETHTYTYTHTYTRNFVTKYTWQQRLSMSTNVQLRSGDCWANVSKTHRHGAVCGFRNVTSLPVDQLRYERTCGQFYSTCVNTNFKTTFDDKIPLNIPLFVYKIGPSSLGF